MTPAADTSRELVRCVNWWPHQSGGIVRRFFGDCLLWVIFSFVWAYDTFISSEGEDSLVDIERSEDEWRARSSQY